jgi:N-methylhydantoinase B
VVRLASGRLLRAKGLQVIPAGDKLVLELPGGAGLGDARERSTAALAADITAGLVSGGA